MRDSQVATATSTSTVPTKPSALPPPHPPVRLPPSPLPPPPSATALNLFPSPGSSFPLFPTLMAPAMEARAWRAGLVLLAVALGGVAEAAAAGEGEGASAGDGGPDVGVCPGISAAESILRGIRDWCPSRSAPPFGIAVANLAGVTEEFVGSTAHAITCPMPTAHNPALTGEEATLQKALNIVQANKDEYVALLFYASWCPFSRACTPNFNALSFLFPTIHHFAFEESLIRPSILSGYGVHGFPTLFLLNSTMRVRYHGSRALSSLIAFYSDVTGIQPVLLDPVVVEIFQKAPKPAKLEEDVELENCPFSWARSPEKFLQEDAYLALATAFLLSRFVYFLLPKILACFKRAWMQHIRYAWFLNLWHCSLAYLVQAGQALAKRNRNTRKRGNLQEGAMNAKIWASKSLVSVSIGEPSSVRTHAGFDRR